jgi:hypothetical protein
MGIIRRAPGYSCQTASDHPDILDALGLLCSTASNQVVMGLMLFLPTCPPSLLAWVILKLLLKLIVYDGPVHIVRCTFPPLDTPHADPILHIKLA